MNPTEAKSLLEALIYASPTPLRREEAARVMEVDPDTVQSLFHELRDSYRARSAGIVLQETAGAYQFVTNPEWAEFVAQLGRTPRQATLTPAALETLAIIAYRQPITRAEIEALRGVRADSALGTLEEHGLIRDVGRKDAPGRPIMFGTTEVFLHAFGLRSLYELPPLPEPTPDTDADTDEDSAPASGAEA